MRNLLSPLGPPLLVLSLSLSHFVLFLFCFFLTEQKQNKMPLRKQERLIGMCKQTNGRYVPVTDEDVVFLGTSWENGQEIPLYSPPTFDILPVLVLEQIFGLLLPQLFSFREALRLRQVCHLFRAWVARCIWQAVPFCATPTNHFGGWCGYIYKEGGNLYLCKQVHTGSSKRQRLQQQSYVSYVTKQHKRATPAVKKLAGLFHTFPIHLALFDCRSELIASVDKMPFSLSCLSILTIKNCNYLEKFDFAVFETGPSSVCPLKRIAIQECRELRSIYFQPDAFPYLEKVMLSQLPSLGFPYAKLAKVPNVCIEYCTGVRQQITQLVPVFWPSEINTRPRSLIITALYIPTIVIDTNCRCKMNGRGSQCWKHSSTLVKQMDMRMFVLMLECALLSVLCRDLTFSFPHVLEGLSLDVETWLKQYTKFHTFYKENNQLFREKASFFYLEPPPQ